MELVKLLFVFLVAAALSPEAAAYWQKRGLKRQVRKVRKHINQLQTEEKWILHLIEDLEKHIGVLEKKVGSGGSGSIPGKVERRIKEIKQSFDDVADRLQYVEKDTKLIGREAKRINEAAESRIKKLAHLTDEMSYALTTMITTLEDQGSGTSGGIDVGAQTQIDALRGRISVDLVKRINKLESGVTSQVEKCCVDHARLQELKFYTNKLSTNFTTLKTTHEAAVSVHYTNKHNLGIFKGNLNFVTTEVDKLKNCCDSETDSILS